MPTSETLEAEYVEVKAVHDCVIFLSPGSRFLDCENFAPLVLHNRKLLRRFFIALLLLAGIAIAQPFMRYAIATRLMRNL